MKYKKDCHATNNVGTWTPSCACAEQAIDGGCDARSGFFTAAASRQPRGSEKQPVALLTDTLGDESATSFYCVMANGSMLKCICELLVRCASHAPVQITASGLEFFASDVPNGRLIHARFASGDMVVFHCPTAGAPVIRHMLMFLLSRSPCRDVAPKTTGDGESVRRMSPAETQRTPSVRCVLWIGRSGVPTTSCCTRQRTGSLAA